MIDKWESDEWLDEDDDVDQPTMVVCRHCEAELDDESINCPVCGRMLDHAAPWANRSAPVRWLMKFVVILLLASMLIPLLIWWF